MHKVFSGRIHKKLVTVASRERNLGVKGQDEKMAGYFYPLFKRKKHYAVEKKVDLCY